MKRMARSGVKGLSTNECRSGNYSGRDVFGRMKLRDEAPFDESAGKESDYASSPTSSDEENREDRNHKGLGLGLARKVIVQVILGYTMRG